MKRCVLLLVLVLLSGCTPAAATTEAPTDAAPPAAATATGDTANNATTADAFSRGAMLADIADNVILPAYADFAVQAAQLDAAVGALATTPTPDTLAAAQQAWRATYIAWQPLELFAVQDVQRTQHYSGMDTWHPDVERIAVLLAGSDPLDEATIAGVGATVRGLPALEYMLFDAAGDNAAVLQALSDAPRRVTYAQALAADIHTRADALLTFWSPEGADYRAAFVAADTGGAVMRSSVSALTNELVNTVDVLVQMELGAPLGRTGDGTPQPAMVEAVHSNAALPGMLRTLDVLRATLTAGGGSGFDDYLTDLRLDPDGGEPLAQRLLAQLDRAHVALSAIDAPLQTAVSTQPAQVTAAYDETRQLLVLMKVDMANALGVTLTFGDTDGD